MVSFKPKTMEQALTQFLKSFQFLTDAEIDILVENTNLCSFKKGSLLLVEGEVSKNCYAVIKGCVREYYLQDGLEKTTAFFTEGQAVNSFSSYIKGVPSKHFLECCEDSVLTVGNQQLEDRMCQLIPRLEKFIRLEVEKHAGELQERMATFMTSTPEQRFLYLLKHQSELMGRVPQHQIASYLGITPESLSRIKKRLYTQKKQSNKSSKNESLIKQ